MADRSTAARPSQEAADVRVGSKTEVRTRKPEVRFALKNGPRQPHLLGPKSANRRHRACTPLANFLRLFVHAKGQSEHNFSCSRALGPPLDAVLAYVADE